jgi:hypothetical protein
MIRYCEARSDAAIQKCQLNQCAGLPRFARNDGHTEKQSLNNKFLAMACNATRPANGIGLQSAKPEQARRF